MDYHRIAQQLLEQLGGKTNISAAAHCATRLRLVLVDESKADLKTIETIEGVKGSFSTGGQTQIIFGSGIVNSVYAAFSQLIGQSDMSTTDVASSASHKQNIIQQAVKGLSDIFVPILPAIVAGGLMMGLYNALIAKGLFVDGLSLVEAFPEMADLASMLNTFANAPFVFLPVLLAFSASKKFGGNPFLGAALGMLMVHPDLLNGWGVGDATINGTIPVWNLFGFEVQKVGYQGSVIPVLVCTFVLAQLEVRIRKIMPSVLDNLLTPLLALLITGFLTFALIGTATRDLGFFLGDGLNWLYESAGMIGGAIFGLLYAPFVITGMHHSFIAIETQLLADIATTGGSFIFIIATMSNIAQGAACLAFGLISNSKKVKGIAMPSAFSALLGITEPAMFGVNLKHKFPFIAAVIGAGIAAGFVTFFQVKAQALGAAGLPGIISVRPDQISLYIAGMAIAFISAFIITLVLNKRQNK